MAKQTINLGSSANSGGGDPLRNALQKVNENFDEVYTKLEALEDGNIATSIIGDIKGSVFADDSTLLVDAVNGIIPGYISIVTLQTEVAASADFDAFKARIAAL
jgi:inosine/xanthosine triphosphate pyrophosphatase family protein